MTMHLAHPSLTLGGKRKGKQKFRNADEARKARQLQELWEQKQAEWKAMSKPIKKVKIATVSPVVSSVHVRANDNIPSLNSWVTGAVNSKEAQHYTGNKMIGIGTLHKSNAVPIFTDDEAKSISSMRR